LAADALVEMEPPPGRATAEIPSGCTKLTRIVWLTAEACRALDTFGRQRLGMHPGFAETVETFCSGVKWIAAI
jgi:hypothetical protein